MSHLIEPDRAVDLWRARLTPILGKRVTDLFVRRTKTPLNEFSSRVIRPYLFLESDGTYVPVADTVKTPGRNHHMAEAIAKNPNIGDEFGADVLQAMTYFANPLRIKTEGTGVDIEAPSQRVVLGRYLVLTLEFDVLDAAYLGKQVSWVLQTKNLLECPMGEFFKACSAYSDFAGISVVYGGHKSLHVHVVFDTLLARESYGLSVRSAAEIRRGYILLWDQIEAIFLKVVDTGGHQADRALRLPEQYRRLPNGIRKAGKGHIFGIPEGTEIPQLTLWEHFHDRAKGDALFLTPDVFAPEPDVESKKLRRYRAGAVGPMASEQVDYCSSQLCALYPSNPRFVRLDFQGDRWTAKFANSSSDREPSSIMREDYQTIRPLGTDADQVKPVILPAPLRDMLRMWCESMPGGSRAPRDETDTSATAKLVRSIEERFAANVIDKASAHNEMRTILMETVARLPLMLVVGPEGVGKTTTIFRDFHLFARKLALKGESTRGMFAFAEYADAATKCARFNELQASNGFFGIVLPSFSRVYNEICVELKLGKITRDVAIRKGYASHFEAVRALQPEVIQACRARHEALHAEIGSKTPVFFVVHQTMHLWRTSSMTRLMWTKSFWTSEQEDQADRINRLREETVIGLAVHDEIKVEHVVEMHPEAVARWVKRLTSKGPWRAQPRDLSACLESFENELASPGAPILHGKPIEITFDEVRRIESWIGRDPDPIIARNSGEYKLKALPLDKDGNEQVNVYEIAHGAEWRVSEHDWWDGLAHQVILLTTERVPTALVSATSSPWMIFELAAPKMPKNVIQVHAERSLTGEKLPEVCADFRKLHPDTYIISNKAKTVANSMPHVTARGSNELIGKSIMQTMTFVTPGKYEELQVLNSWAGRSDLIGLSHVDEMNQSAGRNLGFRYHEGVTHTLLVNRHLFQVLAAGTALGHSRYTLQPILDKDKRHRLKAKASKD